MGRQGDIIYWRSTRAAHAAGELVEGPTCAAPTARDTEFGPVFHNHSHPAWSLPTRSSLDVRCVCTRVLKPAYSSGTVTRGAGEGEGTVGGEVCKDKWTHPNTNKVVQGCVTI